MKRTLALSTAATLAFGSFGIAAAATTAGQGHDNAVAEAKALLALAPTVPGEIRSAKPPVKELDSSPDGSAYRGLVQRVKYWTIDESWKTAYAALTATTPTGLAADGTTSTSGPTLGDREISTVYGPTTMPAGIAYAELQVVVVPTGHDTAAVGVFGEAAPQPVRKANEIVPPSVNRAHVALRTRSGHLVRGNTVTGAAAKTLVADFDALVVDPNELMNCPAFFGRVQVVTFHTDGNTIVATAGFCGMVQVTRDGHRLPPLDMTAKFAKDIRKDLAPPVSRTRRPKRPATEHVPLSLRHVHLARRVEPFDPTIEHRTVSGAQARRLVNAFDTMRTQPYTYLHCDIAGGPTDIVTFRTATHTWVAKESACSNVIVTRDGKSLPTLLANAAWEKAVGHDLGR